MTLLVLIILLKKIQENFKIFLINVKENDLEDNYFLTVIFELITPFKKSIFEIYCKISYFSQQKTTLVFLCFI